MPEILNPCKLAGMIFTQNRKPVSNHALQIEDAGDKSYFVQNGIKILPDEMIQTLVFASNNGINMFHLSGNCNLSIHCAEEAMEIIDRRNDMILSFYFDFDPKNRSVSSAEFLKLTESILWQFRTFFIDSITLKTNDPEKLKLLFKEDGIADLLAEMRYESKVGKWGIETSDEETLELFTDYRMGDLFYRENQKISENGKYHFTEIIHLDKPVTSHPKIISDLKNAKAISLLTKKQVITTLFPLLPVNELMAKGILTAHRIY